MEKTIKLCVTGTIPPRDRGIRVLQKEYFNYKKTLIPKVQGAVRQVIKDRNIKVYAQQKWILDKKLREYIKNLPFHPMTFHNQSVWLEEKKGHFYIHIKTKQEEGEIFCYVGIPSKYHSLIQKACGKDNPVLGQVELIEDRKYGWINTHITLRLPKPEPYEPKGWVGVDVGWNCLAVSAFVTQHVTNRVTSSHRLKGGTVSPELQAYSSKPFTEELIAHQNTNSSKHTLPNKSYEISDVTFHGKDFKTRILQLKYLLKQYQRSGRSWKKWNFRLKNVTKYTVGKIAKEIVEKAEKHQAGIKLENLTFPSHTKRFLIPRYKLKYAMQTLCERKGIPFKLVNPRNTSITCPKCGFISKANRTGKIFHCQKCGYQANADYVATVNIARKGDIAIGYKPTAKAN